MLRNGFKCQIPSICQVYQTSKARIASTNDIAQPKNLYAKKKFLQKEGFFQL